MLYDYQTNTIFIIIIYHYVVLFEDQYLPQLKLKLTMHNMQNLDIMAYIRLFEKKKAN